MHQRALPDAGSLRAERAIQVLEHLPRAVDAAAADERRFGLAAVLEVFASRGKRVTRVRKFVALHAVRVHEQFVVRLQCIHDRFCHHRIGTAVKDPDAIVGQVRNRVDATGQGELARETGKLVNRLPEGADPESRAASTFTVACDAVGGDRARRGTVVGKDIYGLTAALLVKGARIAASGGVSAVGGLAPSQAFDPHTFLEGFERFSLNWDVDDLPA